MILARDRAESSYVNSFEMVDKLGYGQFYTTLPNKLQGQIYNTTERYLQAFFKKKFGASTYLTFIKTIFTLYSNFSVEIPVINLDKILLGNNKTTNNHKKHVLEKV